MKNNSDSKCLECPIGAVCPGGNKIYPLSGYWKRNEMSTEVILCYTPEACLAGNDTYP